MKKLILLLPVFSLGHVCHKTNPVGNQRNVSAKKIILKVYPYIGIFSFYKSPTVSTPVIIAIVVASICVLVSAGGMKDWKESNTWDRTRIIIPAIIALILVAYIITQTSGFERDTFTQSMINLPVK